MFNNFVSLLAANNPLPDWVTSFLPVFQYICLALIGVGAIAMILLVLFQESNSSGGLNAVSGATETYFAQNKGKNKEGRLRKATIILAIVMVVLTLLYFISMQIVNPFAA
ncbi:MAG: preprotein translocase subunit SecG [Clostridia bacterium]|nr:preprotein translocase subunit SecG [Clostridia bacterium]